MSRCFFVRLLAVISVDERFSRHSIFASKTIVESVLAKRLLLSLCVRGQAIYISACALWC